MKKRQQTNQRGRKITNGCSYNNALIHRGSLTIWLEERVVDNWLCLSHHGGRGHGFKFSNLTIETALMLKSLFKLPLRAFANLSNVSDSEALPTLLKPLRQ